MHTIILADPKPTLNEMLPQFLYQIILAIIVSWIVCAIVTAAGGFSSDPKHPTFRARTDARIGVLSEAKWFRFPYPGRSTEN